MKIKIFLSIIVTAYNEEENVENCVRRLAGFLSKNVSTYEIIFVNDGSTDNSKSRLKNLVNTPHLKIINLKKNVGTGGAIKIALKKARGDWYCWFPSDLEILPEELLVPLTFTEKYDIVTTYTVNGGIVRTMFRNYMSQVFTLLINFIFRTNLRYLNGISFVKIRLLKDLEIKSNRFFFHAELLLKTLQRSQNYIEIPISLTPRVANKSKAIKISVFSDIFYCIARSFWELRIKNENSHN